MPEASAANLLEEDHVALGELIDGLCVALDAGDVEQSFARLDLTWARLAVHIRAEHLCLFPAVLDAARRRAASEGSTRQLDEAEAAISQLRHDHDFFMHELAGAVKTMRELRSSDDAAAVEERLRGVRQTVDGVRARLEEHNKLEEGRVYRWPSSVLDEARSVALAGCVRREIGNQPPRITSRPQEEFGRPVKE